MLIYPRVAGMSNTALPSAGTQMWQCRNCPRCSARAAKLEPPRGTHSCCLSARAAPMPPQVTLLKQRENVATGWMDWSSLEVAQDLEKNNRNIAWPGALINRRKRLGSPSVPPSIRAPPGILSYGCKLGESTGKQPENHALAASLLPLMAFVCFCVFIVDLHFILRCRRVMYVQPEEPVSN